MQFIALIYATEDADDVDIETLVQQYAEFEQKAQQEGISISGNALEPVSTATSVQLRDGKKVVTDGPFAETKEQLGGYYLFDCENLDEATEWASRIPSARYGTVEVRPVMVFED